MKTAYRIKHLLTHPTMAWNYARWLGATRLQGHPPIIQPYPGTRLGNWLSFTDFWLNRKGVPPEERALMANCRRQSGAASVAVDVGANVGLFSLALASCGFGSVHAFEPVPMNLVRLRGTLELNPRLAALIETHPTALSDFDGTIEFAIFANSPETCKSASASDVAGGGENQAAGNNHESLL
jgi:hypothetical protein